MSLFYTKNSSQLCGLIERITYCYTVSFIFYTQVVSLPIINQILNSI